MSPGARSTPAFLSRIPPKDAPFQKIWPYLRDGLDTILNFMPGEDISFTAYTNLYTTTYNYFSTARLTNNFGFELYDNIDARFAEHLKQIGQGSEGFHGVDLLRYYSERWKRYTRNASYANRVFIYVNRLWVRRLRDEKHKQTEEPKRDVYPVYTLALLQWKRCIFMPVQEKLISALLGLITQDRDGAPIDQALVKTVVDSLVSLGVDNDNLNKESLDVYDDFERLFMIETERYYKKESEAIIAKHSIPEYLRNADDRLREEEDRVGHYLHASTRLGLIAVCERVLIEEHAKVIRDSFQSLLDGGQYEDLRRMHSLLSRCPGELEPLRKRFETHVDQAAGLLGVVNESSNGDAQFSTSLDEAREELTNCRIGSSGSSEPNTELADESSTENNDGTVADLNQEEEEDYVVI